MSTSNNKRAKTAAHRHRIVIMGAAGFDYHTFNMIYRDDATSEVVAFSFCAEQNLGTTKNVDGSERVYPKEIAGPLYPKGIPYFPESDMASYIKKHNVDEVVFAYSDISHENLMHRASIALAAGADFKFISPKSVQLKSTKPIISICAVRTGVGKSSVSRACVRYFRSKGLRCVAVREPMPYGDLNKQRCMRFETMQDLDDHNCSVEEREEYENYVTAGMVIFSGVDYADVLRAAEKEADVIVWDGGNNEVSFFQSDLLLVLADPLRQGHENRYHPGETNVRMADGFILAKCHEASLADMASVEKTLRSMAKTPDLPIIRLASTTRFLNPEQDEALVKGKKVIVVDDGPTLTHGNTSFGAGYVLATKHHLDIIDPKPHAVGCFVDVFREFSHLKNVLPAMGYTQDQLDDLAETLNRSGAEVVVNGSPSDLARLLGPKLKIPMVRVLYDVVGMPGSKNTLEETFDAFLAKNKH